MVGFPAFSCTSVVGTTTTSNHGEVGVTAAVRARVKIRAKSVKEDWIASFCCTIKASLSLTQDQDNPLSVASAMTAGD